MKRIEAVLGSLVALFWIGGLSTIEATAEDFLVLEGRYFGQSEPGKQAVSFAPGLISLPGRYEFAVSFSPSGDELFFTQQIPEKPASVYYSRVESGRWTQPAPVSLSRGAKAEEMEAFFSPDGKHVFFAPYDEGLDVRLWALDITERGWTNPRELGPPLVETPAFYPTASSSGALYYTNLAERRIFRAGFDDGTVSSARDAAIDFGGHAFIAPNESFVLLDARADDSLGGSDLYVAFRQADGSWGRPRHLGPEVNTSFSETCPSLSADGRFLFFSRYDEENEISDIYWIDASILEGLKPTLGASAP